MKILLVKIARAGVLGFAMGGLATLTSAAGHGVERSSVSSGALLRLAQFTPFSQDTVKRDAKRAQSVVPQIADYVWSAEKLSEGPVTVSGFAPSAGFKDRVAARIGGSVADSSRVTVGAPDGFAGAALSGLDALARLRSGRLSFAKGTWSLNGTVGSPEEKAAVLADLSSDPSFEAWLVLLTVEESDDGLGRPAAQTAAREDEDSEIDATLAPSDEEDVTLVPEVETTAQRADTATEDRSSEADGTEAAALPEEGPATPAEDAGVAAAELPAQQSPITEAETDSAAEGIGQQEPATLRQDVETAPTESTSVAGLPSTIEPGDEDATEPAAEAALPSEPALEGVAEPQPTTPEVANVGPEPQPVVASDYSFSASRAAGEPVTLSGEVPADAARRYFGVVAGNVATEGLEIAPNAPTDFLVNATAGLRAVERMSEADLSLAQGRWSLRGKTNSEAERQAVLASIAALPSSEAWDLDVAAPPPIELCRSQVAALAGRNAIVFRSGSAEISDESKEVLDELAGDLRACPNSLVHVEGYTDADGDDGRNLSLSVERAEAVVAALVERGVAAERLYAIGYGESLPVADNSTAEGKRLNRRIAFSVLDDTATVVQ